MAKTPKKKPAGKIRVKRKGIRAKEVRAYLAKQRAKKPTTGKKEVKPISKLPAKKKGKSTQAHRQDYSERKEKQKMGAFAFAASKGNLNDVERLLKRGLDVNGKPQAASPLYWASRNGHTEVVKRLIDAGATIDYTSKISKSSPLHAATFFGHISVMNVLLAAGAKVDHRDNIKRSPLHVAAMRGKLRTVRTLLDAGARVDLYDEHANSIMHSAVSGGNPRIITLLAEAGAPLHSSSPAWQRTPLEFARYMGDYGVSGALRRAGAKTRKELYLEKKNKRKKTN